MAGNKYTQMTLKMLRKAGWTCAITEHWNPFAKIRQDLFGFIDILAMCDLGETNLPAAMVAVQSTSGAHHAARKNKILSSPLGRMWLKHSQVWLISWTKKKNRWIPRVEIL